MPPSRGSKGDDAELLCHKWLLQGGWTVHRARRSGSVVALKTGKRFLSQSHDLFGCVDLLAIHPERGTWALQVTTQGGRSARRRKIEEVPWDPAWRVSLVTHEAVENPANRAKRKHYWRIEEWQNGTWAAPYAIGFDRSETQKVKVSA